MRYRYDNANRLIAIDELLTPPSTVRPLKSFHYARGNNGDDLRAGKLVLAKRVNWVDIVDPLRPADSGIFPITLSQAYRYEGRDGRVSKRQTRYNFGEGHYLFDTGFEYDQQGNVSRLTYPTCLHAECGGAGPTRTIDFNYTRGYLSSIPGYANHLYYQLGGMFQQVSHANGVVETVEHAFRNLPRPARITTSGTTTGDSGAYEYDGAGNIKSIGSQTYVYDRMSRLLDGHVEIPGVESHVVPWLSSHFRSQRNKARSGEFPDCSAYGAIRDAAVSADAAAVSGPCIVEPSSDGEP